MHAPIPDGFVGIDTTSKSGKWSQLSPFKIGPCNIPGESCPAKNMENAWQFAKVYKQHVDNAGNPTEEYWEWARRGWADSFAHRYPMGKGAIPEYSLWNNEKLGYIDARKRIYGRLYLDGVMETRAYDYLLEMMGSSDIALRDYDAYDHRKLGMTLTDVLNNPKKKMGHAFFLMAALTADDVLDHLA